jgi:hypothetical protein
LQAYLYHNAALCKFAFFVTSWSTTCSSFMVIAIATDRLRRIREPSFKDTDMLRANKAVGVVVVLGTLLTLPFLQMVGITTPRLLHQDAKLGVYIIHTCWLDGDYHWDEDKVLPKLYKAVLATTFTVGCLILCGSYGMIAHEIHNMTRDLSDEITYTLEHPQRKYKLKLPDIIHAKSTEIMKKRSQAISDRTALTLKMSVSKLPFYERLAMAGGPEGPAGSQIMLAMSTNADDGKQHKTSRIKKISAAVANFFVQPEKKTTSSADGSTFVTKDQPSTMHMTPGGGGKGKSHVVDSPSPSTPRSGNALHQKQSTDMPGPGAPNFPSSSAHSVYPQDEGARLQDLIKVGGNKNASALDDGTARDQNASALDDGTARDQNASALDDGTARDQNASSITDVLWFDTYLGDGPTHSLEAWNEARNKRASADPSYNKRPSISDKGRTSDRNVPTTTEDVSWGGAFDRTASSTLKPRRDRMGGAYNRHASSVCVDLTLADSPDTNNSADVPTPLTHADSNVDMLRKQETPTPQSADPGTAPHKAPSMPQTQDGAAMDVEFVMDAHGDMPEEYDPSARYSGQSLQEIEMLETLAHLEDIKIKSSNWMMMLSVLYVITWLPNLLAR